MQVSNSTWTLGDGQKIPKLCLIADEGHKLTKDGLSFWDCIEVDEADFPNWAETEWFDVPVEASDNDSEATVEDYEEMLGRLGV